MSQARTKTPRRYVVMGAGEVGRHLALTLSRAGHTVTIIDHSEEKRPIVEEQLDVGFVHGNGSHVRTLEAAEVARCDLFVAASSSDEANLAAALLAKRAGAPRTVVRLSTSDDITFHGSTYEQAFQADLLLSTQLLATTRILNHVLGYNTLEVEYLARGALQLRKTHIEPGSILLDGTLAQARLPKHSLVLAFLSSQGEQRLVVPTGEDRARPGDDALIFARSSVIDEVERKISAHSKQLGLIVVAGGGKTARSVVRALGRRTRRVKWIELDRARAEALAAEFPSFEIIHGDATDPSTLAAEGVAEAHAFIALTGHDESNLMACLLAQELGVRHITALVERSETSTLWHKVGLLDIVSPRVVAAERIREYIDNDYQASISTLDSGEARFVRRRIQPASPAAGARLADIVVPRGLIVAAILRGDDALVPGGDDRIEVGDEVILFVHRSELALVQLAFPGSEGL
ncbi:MAG: Trk system potassium transporter TrkA [Myxococcota bacterium]|nr:Trk system potassium transporter TrkA [Myxococcales bacterium]